MRRLVRLIQVSPFPVQVADRQVLSVPRGTRRLGVTVRGTEACLVCESPEPLPGRPEEWMRIKILAVPAEGVAFDLPVESEYLGTVEYKGRHVVVYEVAQ